MGAICAVATCLQYIRHNRKHSRVSNTRQEMLGKMVAGWKA